MAVLADTTAFWVTSRAAGISALVCSSGAVAAGLLLGLRAVRGRAAEVRAVHEGLALATLAALALHAVALLFDPWLQPSLGDILVPFAGEHAPFWTGLGIIAGWSLLALGLSYYARGRIGPARWRRLHRFTALAWLLSVGHALGAGTDAGAWWFLGSVAIVVIPALTLLVARLTDEPDQAPQPAAAAPRREPVRPSPPARAPRLWGPPAR